MPLEENEEMNKKRRRRHPVGFCSDELWLVDMTWKFCSLNPHLPHLSLCFKHVSSHFCLMYLYYLSIIFLIFFTQYPIFFFFLMYAHNSGWSGCNLQRCLNHMLPLDKFGAWCRPEVSVMTLLDSTMDYPDTGVGSNTKLLRDYFPIFPTAQKYNI